MAEPRDWLILALTRPGDHMVWYADGGVGYTWNLLTAGRFTRAEAAAEQARVPHRVLAVPLAAAVAVSRPVQVVDGGSVRLERLRRAAARFTVEPGGGS